MRQEGKKMAKLKKKWRRPRGLTSKLRMHEKARGPRPGVGYGAPRSKRGKNKAGLLEFRVFTPSQVTPELKNHILVIGGSVGKLKKIQILKKAEELGIKVSNA